MSTIINNKKYVSIKKISKEPIQAVKKNNLINYSVKDFKIKKITNKDG
jgi:hypothetical protein